MESTVKGSERLTKQRRARRQRLTRKRLFGNTPEGVASTADTGLLELLIDFLEGKEPNNRAPAPPAELEERLGRIPDPCPFVALAILAPLLDRIERGWDDRSTFRDPWRTQLAEQLGERLGDEFARKEMKLAEALEAELKGERLVLGKRRGRPSTHGFLHSDWTPTECVVAGNWMLDVAEQLPCFDYDENGRLCITPEWQARIDKAREDIAWSHPVWLPHRAPPKPWTGWWVKYGDRLRARFVRDWRAHVRPAIEATFAGARPPEKPSGPFAPLADLSFDPRINDSINRLLPFAHADGVNALKRVPLRINQDLVPLVAKFAVELMRPDVKKIVGGVMEMGPHGKKMRIDYDVVAGPDDKKLKADRRTVRTDLRDAHWCGEEEFYLDYNCDKRGRLYAIQHLNYAREDHCRSLFQFARPAPLTADGKDGKEAMQWLEIHAANCWGEDKKPWHDRVRWANENAGLIERVAADPEGTFDDWHEADKPLAFVAACLELSGARKNPGGFETRLPIGFDGTANGLQHLVLLSFDRQSHNLATERDWEAARLVNLIDAEEPHDIYLAVTRRVVELLVAEDARLFSKHKGRVYERGERGFEALDRDGHSIGFFPDEASAKAAVKRLPKPQGKSKRDAWCFDFWRNQLSEMDESEKRKLFKNPIMTFPYSSKVSGMADEMVDVYSELFELNEPEDDAAIFLARAVRVACQDILPGPTRIMKYIRELALHRYKEDKFLEWISPTGFPFVNMYHYPRIVPLELSGGMSRYKVADGALPTRRKAKMLNAASPNFIHALDAAHLIRTVLTANREGIHDILTVHDSYSCLAPFARPFGLIIRREMAMLHAIDPLRALSKANGDPLPLPQRGNIDPLSAQSTEYSFM